METYKEITFDEAMEMVKNDETEMLYVKHKGALQPSRKMNFGIYPMLKERWFRKITDCIHLATLQTRSGDGALILERCAICDKKLFQGAITDEDPIKPEVSG